jgi:hypothetical protein
MGRMNSGTPRMNFLALIALALCAALFAGEKKSPQGRVEDETVAITATLLSPEQLKQTFGSDFDNEYTVVDVTIAPKGGKPYVVRLDDFILRSESTGEHSGPLVAGQIAGAGALVVERTYANRPNADSARTISGTKIQIKDDAKPDPALGLLKQKILIEKSGTEPVSGFLFFPLSKQKPKNLILSCTTPAGKLRLSFR